MKMKRLLFLVSLIFYIDLVRSVGMVIPPLTHHTKFTSSFTLSDYLKQADEQTYRQTVQEYFEEIPCLRQSINTVDHKENFIIIKLRFPNVEENSYNSKGFKNQILNMNILHRKGHDYKDVDIIRNKKDITEESMRIDFKLPTTGYHRDDEIAICFENILIDRSKLLKSLKKEEASDLISREIEVEVEKFASVEEFHKLNNNYGEEMVQDFEKQRAELDKLEELILAMINKDIADLQENENIKRDLNEQIFKNTLIFQVVIIIAILVVNIFYLYRILTHLAQKKIVIFSSSAPPTAISKK